MISESESEIQRLEKIKKDVIRQIILLHESELRFLLGSYIPMLAQQPIDFVFDTVIFKGEVEKIVGKKMGNFIKRLGNEAKEYYSTYEVPGQAMWEDSDNLNLIREVINFFVEEYADDIVKTETVEIDLDSFDEMNYEMNTADAKFNFYISLALSLMESYEKGKEEMEELENNTVLNHNVITLLIDEITGELEEIKIKLGDVKKAVAKLRIC